METRAALDARHGIDDYDSNQRSDAYEDEETSQSSSTFDGQDFSTEGFRVKNFTTSCRPSLPFDIYDTWTHMGNVKWNPEPHTKNN